LRKFQLAPRPYDVQQEITILDEARVVYALLERLDERLVVWIRGRTQG